MKITRKDLKQLKKEIESKIYGWVREPYDKGHNDGLEAAIELINELLNKTEK